MQRDHREPDELAQADVEGTADPLPFAPLALEPPGRCRGGSASLASSVTSSLLGPSRFTVSVTVSPGRWLRMATISSALSATGLPSMATITSPGSRPAFSAGPPGTSGGVPSRRCRWRCVRPRPSYAPSRLAPMIGNSASPLSMQLLDGAADLVDRDREADADVAALAAEAPAADGRDRGVDPDDLAVEVDQRAAGVAGVDGGVGLDRVDVGAVARTALAAGGHRPVLGADDAARHRAGQAERRADRDDRVADDDAVGVAERQGRQVLGVDRRTARS